LAEEAAQDALVKALQLWPHEGVPSNPTAWLIQVAKNRALDLLLRDQRLTDLEALDASSPLSTESPPHAADTAGSAGAPLSPPPPPPVGRGGGAPPEHRAPTVVPPLPPTLSPAAPGPPPPPNVLRP